MDRTETRVKKTEVISDTPAQVHTTVKQVTTAPPVRTEHPQTVYETKKSIFRTYQVVWYILGVIEVLLAFRVFLRLVGANPASGFATFIYTLSEPFAGPFAGVLRMSIAPQAGSVMEWSTLLAMVVYWIFAYGLVELLQFIKPVTPQEVEQAVDTQ